MKDIYFECPHCSQPLEAPPDMAGEAIACPAERCGLELCIPGFPTAPPALPTDCTKPAPSDGNGAHGPLQSRQDASGARSIQRKGRAGTWVVASILAVKALIACFAGAAAYGTEFAIGASLLYGFPSVALVVTAILYRRYMRAALITGLAIGILEFIEAAVVCLIMLLVRMNEFAGPTISGGQPAASAVSPFLMIWLVWIRYYPLAWIYKALETQPARPTMEEAIAARQFSS